MEKRKNITITVTYFSHIEVHPLKQNRENKILMGNDLSKKLHGGKKTDISTGAIKFLCFFGQFYR